MDWSNGQTHLTKRLSRVMSPPAPYTKLLPFNESECIYGMDLEGNPRHRRKLSSLLSPGPGFCLRTRWLQVPLNGVNRLFVVLQLSTQSLSRHDIELYAYVAGTVYAAACLGASVFTVTGSLAAKSETKPSFIAVTSRIDSSRSEVSASLKFTLLNQHTPR